MRYALLVGMIALAFGVALPARAQLPEPKQRISLELRDTPLRQALKQLFEGTGKRFIIKSEVKDSPITLTFRNVPVEVALRLILVLARQDTPDIRFESMGDCYVILSGR